MGHTWIRTDRDIDLFTSGIVITPDGTRAYVVNDLSKTVSVIDTATNKAVATVTVGAYPSGIAITPDGKSAYVTTHSSFSNDGTISIIDTATNTMVAIIPAGLCPAGIAITPKPTPEQLINTLLRNLQQYVPGFVAPPGFSIPC